MAANWTTGLEARVARLRAAPSLLLIVGIVVIAGAAQGLALLKFQPPGLDFLPPWTAARLAWRTPGAIYDFAQVTRAQAWLLPNFAWARPFAYPPSALPLLALFSGVPFWPALALWSGLGAGLLAWGSARLAPAARAPAVALTLALPATVIALDAGQATLIVAALLALAMAGLERRPRLSGVLLGLAAALKPQAALMAPVALAAAGAWDAGLWAAAALSACAAASAAMFGWEPWRAWGASLPAFARVIEATPNLGAAVIAPAWLGRELGLAGELAAVWAAIFATLGAWLTWRAFRASSAPTVRLAALAAGSLMASPYAMSYDGALIAPAAAALAVSSGPQMRLLALAAAFALTTPRAGPFALVAFAAYVAVAARSESERSVAVQLGH
jgi:hypothetical protein